MLALVDGPFFDLGDPPQLKMVEWRQGHLTRAGVGLMDARILAVRRDIELHQMLNMLRDGCPVHLLKEILL